VNLLDRHIFRSVLATALAAVALFTFVLVAGNIIRDLLGLLLSGQLPFLSFWKLVLLLIPFVIYYALPLGMLTGVLLTLGRLSSDSEITAMRAAGISVIRIARPVLILAVLGIVLGLRVNFETMPWARVQYHTELAAAVRASPLGYIKAKTFIRDFPDCVIYVEAKEAGTKSGQDIQGVWIWFLDSERRVYRFLRAKSGHVDYDESTNEFIITLANAQDEEHDRKAPDDYTQALRAPSAEQADPIRLSLARYFGGEAIHKKLPWMTYGELVAEKSRLEGEPVAAGKERQHERDIMKVTLTIQDKINMALAIFTFAFVGVPLGIKVSRRETSANLAVAVLLALGYYFLIVVVGWLDQHPEYRPDLLLWVPNILLLGLGLWLLRRLDRAS
jgi:lipopolysaccharide export system permease protein